MEGSTEERDVAAPPSDETMKTALRLASVLDHMRAEGRFNVEVFLQAAEGGMGGSCILQAPSQMQKRGVPEAKFVSEGITYTV